MKLNCYKGIALFIFLFFSLFLKAQDFIITTSGDTLSVKIEKKTTYSLYYTTELKETTYINLAFVKEYQWNSKKSIIHPKETKSIKSSGQELYKIGINLGAGYNIGKESDLLSDGYNDYINGLRLGFQFSANIHFFVKPFLGIGMHYSSFQSSNSESQVLVNSTRRVDLEDEVRYRLLGPSFSLRPAPYAKNPIYINICFGYSRLLQKSTLEGEKSIIENVGLGSSIALAYDRYLNEDFQLGFQIAFVNEFATFDVNEKSFNSPNTVQFGSVARIEMSLGLRFRH